MKFFRITFLSFFSISLLLDLSACGAKINKNQSLSKKQQSTPNSNGTSQSAKNNKQPANGSQSSQSQNNPMQGDQINGVWKATGEQDGRSSTWFFNKGKLVVNYVYNYSYKVSKTKDLHGYTVVTIKNSEGKQHHALLLKRNGSNYTGITAEGKAYDNYLVDGTVPKGQLIDFKLEKNTWGSMDEAIDFWENTYRNSNNAISKKIAWTNYRRDLWSLVKDGTSGHVITLHFTNISGAGGSYDQLVKKDDTTVITTYDGNASYPKNPTMSYTVRNKDYKVIKTEDVWKQK